MTDYTTPSQFIAGLLEERGWMQKALAVVLDQDESTINKWLAGRGSITVDTALILEEVFGVEADKFLELQRSYDLAVARLQKNRTLHAPSAQLYMEISRLAI